MAYSAGGDAIHSVFFVLAWHGEKGENRGAGCSVLRREPPAAVAARATLGFIGLPSLWFLAIDFSPRSLVLIDSMVV